MAYFRISELAPGVVPVPAAALIEISVPDASTISGYDSHRVSVSEFFTDVTLSGLTTAPTQPPGSNNNFIATTEYVDHAVAAGVAAAPYVELAGDTMTGDLHTPRVYVTAEYWFQDRTGAELWALYTEAGTARLFTNGSDKFTVNDLGDAVVGRNLAVNGSANINNAGSVFWWGPGGTNLRLYDDGNSHIESTTQLWLNSNGLPVIAGGQFLAQTDVIAYQNFYTYSSGDAGPSTDRGFFSGRVWRFKQNAGDDSAAGSIGYRNYDTAALAIVGAGGSPRRVKIFDFLDVAGGGYYGSTLNINYQILFQRAGQSSTLAIYDDGNSHIEGVTTLWLQSSGQLARFGGQVDIYGGATVAGYTTVGDFRSNANVYVPNGYGYFGSYIEVDHTSERTTAAVFYKRDGAGDTGIALNNGRRVWEVDVLASFVYTDSYAIVDRSANKAVFWADANGVCYCWGGDWGSASDPAIKQDVEPYTRGLEAIRNLRPVTYRYVAGTPYATEDEPSAPRRGLMVDEVLPHLPEICGKTQFTLGGETKDIGVLFAGELVYAVINSLKEIAERLEAVEARTKETKK
jgi:hypothetical protein